MTAFQRSSRSDAHVRVLSGQRCKRMRLLVSGAMRDVLEVRGRVALVVRHVGLGWVGLVWQSGYGMCKSSFFYLTTLGACKALILATTAAWTGATRART